MYKAELNVPVALNVFIRKNELQQVFDSVKQARPYILFLIGDGPRTSVPSDKEKISMCRKIVEDVDWECEVHKIYSDENKGMYRTYFEAQKYIFDRVDRYIFLEDDVLVSQSFYKFCEEMLDRYENDLRVHYVTGLNYMGLYDAPESDYFFCGEGSIWGYAIWKRTYLSQNMDYAKSQYITNCMCDVARQLKPGYENKIKGYIKDPKYEGHVPGPEFFKNMLRFSQNQLYIVPTKNMVSNIGVGDGSIHSSDSLKKMANGTQQLFYRDTYEYTFPLKHPEYVVRDVYYENYVNRVLAWNHPLVNAYRKVESAIRCALFGDFKQLLRKIIASIMRPKEK